MQATIHWFLFSVFFVFNRLAQADGDLPALEQVLGKKNIHHVIGSGSCSALIKLLLGNKDLFISQVTWNSYSGMLRVFKLYDIPVSVSGDKGKSHHQKAGLFTRNYPLLLVDCKYRLQWESYMYSQNSPTIIQRTPLYYRQFCWSLWFLKSHITVKHSTSISCKQCLLQEQTTYCPNITSATTHGSSSLFVAILMV